MSDRTFDWSRIALLALAVAGLLLSGLLLKMHDGQKAPEVLAWACGGQQLDCSKVLQSGYSRITILPPRKVPVAVIGTGYFTLLGLWLLAIGRLPGRLHNAWAIPALLALLGLTGSIFMVYLMAKVLKAWCGLCLATHAVNLPLALGLWTLWLAGRQREPRDELSASTGRQLWKIPALVVIAGAAVGLTQVRQTQLTDATRALEAESNALDRLAFGYARKQEIPVTADDPAFGPAGARHTVVVFSDFQCPYCAQFAPMLHEIQKALSPDGDITRAPFRIIFKHYPLNTACNPGRDALLAGKSHVDHPLSCEAAAAAEAARVLGGNEAFWKMHDLLFANQALLKTEPYKQLAARAGLNPDEFDRLRQDPKVRQRVSQDALQGHAAGVRSTPTVFLDGRRIDRPVKTFDPQQVTARTVAYWRDLLLWASLPVSHPGDAGAYDAAIRQLPAAPAARASASHPATTRPARSS